jgi:predicted TIM-barrel fold metal-dependent hydrolase
MNMSVRSVPSYGHPEPNLAWLARQTEDILAPALPIIDPHHHLWDRAGNEYYLDELLTDTAGGHNIIATVFLLCNWAFRKDGAEALRPVGETEAVMKIVREAERRGVPTKVCAGIVAYADLCLGDRVDEVLEAHRAAAEGHLRGVRYVTARDEGFVASIAPPPPARLMSDSRFRAGFARLERFGLSFDAWLYHTQVPELTDLARAFPAVPIILNHVGGPVGIGPYRGRRDDVFRDWSKAVRELATCQNVSMKLGGLAMLVAGFDFHERPNPPCSEDLATAWKPYMETCIEVFGPQRCMFESNFPVDKAMCSYAVLWNAFKRLAAGASATETAALFHHNAARTYRITA